jgi:hypothetical protein
VTSLLGGALGASILPVYPTPFDRLVPWLLLGATLMFAFGDHLRRHLGLRLVSASGEIGWDGWMGFELRFISIAHGLSLVFDDTADDISREIAKLAGLGLLHLGLTSEIKRH